MMPIARRYQPNPFIDSFLESMEARKLKYYASEIFSELGYTEPHEVEEDIKRVVNICDTMHIPISENVKTVYRYRQNGVFQDFKLSPLVCYLIMLNGNPCNPKVAEAQLSILSKISNLEA